LDKVSKTLPQKIQTKGWRHDLSGRVLAKHAQALSSIPSATKEEKEARLAIAEEITSVNDGE
jgi:hypothetical protein